MDKYTTTTGNQVTAVVGPGKRACSLCRQPGHRAKNCPNAHVVQQQKKQAAAAPKQKRTRKPMSPEQRAKAAQNLIKARAARKK